MLFLEQQELKLKNQMFSWSSLFFTGQAYMLAIEKLKKVMCTVKQWTIKIASGDHLYKNQLGF